MLSIVVTGYSLSGGKVRLAGGFTLTGPVMVKSAAFDSLGQGPEVVEDMGVSSLPAVGLMVLKPSEPGGGTAPATPFTSNTDPAATTATTAPDISRVNKFFLCTM